MGFIVDKTNSKHGKARPYLIWISIPFAISAVLAFTSPDVSQLGKVIYATVTYILVTTLYTTINIPYGVLASKMTSDQTERASLGVWRMASAVLGTMIVASLILPLAKVIGGDNMAFGAPAAMGFFALIAVVLFFVVFKNTTEVVGNKSHVAGEKRNDEPNLITSIKALLKNRAWIIVLLVQTLMFAGTTGKSASTAYYAIYVLDKPGLIGPIMMLPMLGMMVTMILFSEKMASKLGKVKSIMICTFVAGILTLINFFIPDTSITLILIMLILSNMALGPTMALMAAMLADTIEYGEYKTGIRIEGLTYAAGSMGTKIGAGLAGALVGIILAVTGYVPNVEQTPEVIFGIKSIMYLIPGISLIVVSGLMFLNDLDKVYPEAVRALALKKGNK